LRQDGRIVAFALTAVVRVEVQLASVLTECEWRNTYVRPGLHIMALIAPGSPSASEPIRFRMRGGASINVCNPGVNARL
jgi:hypothetical protein